MQDFPVVDGFQAPSDAECKTNRRAIVLQERDGYLDLVPISTVLEKSWRGVRLDGPACQKSGLTKDGYARDHVIRVSKDSVWVRGVSRVGRIQPSKDVRFAEKLCDLLAQAQCFIVHDTEMPLLYVKGSGVSPLSRMSYCVKPYLKVL